MDINTSSRYQRLKWLTSGIKGRNIYLYGAGIRGRVAIDNLEILGLSKNLKGFIDDNVDKSGVVYCGKKVFSISDIPNADKNNSVFIISTYAIKNISKKLMENDVSINNILYIAELLIDNIDTNIFHENAESIQKVYSLLQDSLSKFIYKSIFEIYQSGNLTILSRTRGEKQYFPLKGNNDYVEGFCFSDEECFVDGGGYTGDTVDEFVKIVSGRFKNIYTFEPNVENYKVMREKYTNDNRVQIFPYGMYSQDTVLRLQGGGTSSRVAADGDIEIEARIIDTLIPRENRVTFLKMDIEGCEKEALRGASEIIRRNHPKLAICIYHKIEDLWEIPLLIYRFNPKYKLYIRNYEDRLDEIVCYAISEE